MTPEQEIEYGKRLARQARKDGHFPSKALLTDTVCPKKSKKRTMLREYFKANPGPMTVKDITERLDMSSDTARRCCGEFVREGWLDINPHRTGSSFQVKPSSNP